MMPGSEEEQGRRTRPGRMKTTERYQGRVERLVGWFISRWKKKKMVVGTFSPLFTPNP